MVFDAVSQAFSSLIQLVVGNRDQVTSDSPNFIYLSSAFYIKISLFIIHAVEKKTIR